MNPTGQLAPMDLGWCLIGSTAAMPPIVSSTTTTNNNDGGYLNFLNY